jgi:undecaprenyl-phosphate 4-deoxy-4-formamido-L-arabinose transferase
MVLSPMPSDHRQNWISAMPSTSIEMERVHLSVVIPVYNSAATLPALVERLVSALEHLNRSFEIVFVDDGSADTSFAVLMALRERYPRHIIAIQLMRNFGQHNALMCGLRHARGSYLITMDDDLQNPPEEIPKLVEKIEHDRLDLVYASYDSKQHNRWRNSGSNTILFFYRTVFGSTISPTSFRIMRRELAESIFSYNLNFTYLDGLLAWNTQRIATVTTKHEPRRSGRSGYSIAKLLMLALNLFTNFSLLPLQLVSAVGLMAASVGIATGLYFLAQYFLSHISVPGYASTIIAILVLGGIQLLAIGIMGEYLGRVHLNINRKPQYTERVVLSLDMGDDPQNDDRATTSLNVRSSDRTSQSRTVHELDLPRRG